MTKDEALRLALKALEIGLPLIEDFGSTEQFNAQHKAITAIYEALAQRTWVGLTDEERNNIWDTIGNSDAHGDVDGWSGRDVMKAIEAKLKEKNT